MTDNRVHRAAKAKSTCCSRLLAHSVVRTSCCSHCNWCHWRQPASSISRLRFVLLSLLFLRRPNRNESAAITTALQSRGEHMPRPICIALKHFQLCVCASNLPTPSKPTPSSSERINPRLSGCRRHKICLKQAHKKGTASLPQTSLGWPCCVRRSRQPGLASSWRHRGSFAPP